MATIIGGVVSDEIYSKFSLKNWLTSFLKLDENRWRRVGGPLFGLRQHADAFKKCVTANPDRFRDFVQEISGREDVMVMYKVAGVEGLLAGGDEPLSLWNLTAPYISVEYAKKDSYSFSQITDYYIKAENPYLDNILKVAELLSVIPFERNNNYYYSSDDDTKHISRRANNLLEHAINTFQGRAVELLIHTCAIPERRKQVYGIIGRLQASFSEPLKTLPLLCLYVKDSFDESLYFPLMKQLLAGLGPEALFLRTDAIQWCFYHKNDFVKDYIDRIEPDPISHEILSQIYFYGLCCDNRDDCRKRLEKILLCNEEKVIAKIVETALKSFCHPEMKEYAIELLRRFTSDGRYAVANAYCCYCDSLPIEAFGFYCDIAKSWTGKKHLEIYNQLKYVKKCVSKYPKECYKLISDQKYSEIDGHWIVDNDDVVRVLLEIYNKLKENEDEVTMNEIMDLFDEYIYRGNQMIIDVVEK